MNVPVAAWIAALAAIAILVAVDLGVQYKGGERGMRAAVVTSTAWIAAAVAFGAVVWAWAGPGWAGQYFAGYLTEKALSIDNLFVFAIVLDGLRVPAAARQRVLRWGVIGALGARAVLIIAGVSLLEHFWWASYLLGAAVVVTGARLLVPRRQASPPGGRLLRVARKLLPVADGDHHDQFFVRTPSRSHRRQATTLLVALVVIEATDIAFAVDSVPAVLALTTEPFIVLSSKAFAVLGLRSLYFVLDGILDRLRYLHLGLAAILILVGARMLLADVWEAPLWAALGSIAAVLAITTVASLARPDPPAESATNAERLIPAHPAEQHIPSRDPRRGAGLHVSSIPAPLPVPDHEVD